MVLSVLLKNTIIYNSEAHYDVCGIAMSQAHLLGGHISHFLVFYLKFLYPGKYIYGFK